MTAPSSERPIGRALTRRGFVLGAALLASGCAARTIELAFHAPDPADYGPLPDEKFPVPAVPPGAVNPMYMRRIVAYETTEKPGTIIVDPENKFLYLTMANGQAMRYGVGVGREGFAWNGTAVIRHKAEWPTWTPPSEMIDRQPELEKYRTGMPGGIKNPLGARALYLYQGGRDTLYRLHGTNAPRSIGHNVSSGCVRLINQDIIDLYARVPLGTRVVVLQPAEKAA